MTPYSPCHLRHEQPVGHSLSVSVRGIEIASASPAAVVNSTTYVPSSFAPKIMMRFLPLVGHAGLCLWGVRRNPRQVFPPTFPRDAVLKCDLALLLKSFNDGPIIHANHMNLAIIVGKPVRDAKHYRMRSPRRGYAASSYRRSPPLLLCLPLHRGRVGVLELQPVRRPAGTIARAEPL